MRSARWSSIIVGLLAGILGAGAGGFADAQTPAQEQAPDYPVVTERELFATPGAMSDGATVRLDGVVIRAKSGNVLRVAIGHHEIFVAPNNPSTLGFLAIGARVDVLGTLRRAPSARQAQLIYAMETREARRLARTRYYVEAWSVSGVE